MYYKDSYLQHRNMYNTLLQLIYELQKTVTCNIETVQHFRDNTLPHIIHILQKQSLTTWIKLLFAHLCTCLYLYYMNNIARIHFYFPRLANKRTHVTKHALLSYYILPKSPVLNYDIGFITSTVTCPSSVFYSACGTSTHTFIPP